MTGGESAAVTGEARAGFTGGAGAGVIGGGDRRRDRRKQALA